MWDRCSKSTTFRFYIRIKFPIILPSIGNGIKFICLENTKYRIFSHFIQFRDKLSILVSRSHNIVLKALRFATKINNSVSGYCTCSNDTLFQVYQREGTPSPFSAQSSSPPYTLPSSTSRLQPGQHSPWQSTSRSTPSSTLSLSTST